MKPSAKGAGRRPWIAIARSPIVLLVLSFAFPRPSFAGLNTYADIFPGDRAAGLGGAYTALSSDGSGAFYNPAGLARIEFADLSLSASAYQYQSLTYDDGFFGRDWSRKGGLLVPTNFGAIRRWGDVALGLSVAVPEAWVLRTNKIYRNVSLQGFEFDLEQDFKDTGETYDVGPTLAWSISPDLSVGVTVYYVYGTRERVSFFKIADPADPSTVENVSFATSQEDVTGVTGVIGLQWQLDPCLRLGLALRPPADLHHFRKEQDTLFFGVTEPPGLVPAMGTPVILNKGFTEGVPFSATGGVAWLPREDLTLTLDFSYHLDESFPGFVTPVKREPTWNVSAGVEYYVLPQIPVRAGFYTNNSSAPEPKAGSLDRRERIDTYGFTVGANWVSEHTELGVGLRQGFAVGKFAALSVEDVQPIVDISGIETAILLSSRYKF